LRGSLRGGGEGEGIEGGEGEGRKGAMREGKGN